MRSYNSGYGQAKADIKIAIGEAFKMLNYELENEVLSNEERKMINAKIDALKWTRAIITSIKSNKL